MTDYLFTANQETKLKSTRQSHKVYMAIENPSTMWVGLVNGAHDVGSIWINFTGDTTYTTPVADMTLLVGSDVGKFDYGIVRFRAFSGSQVNVGYNHIEWQDGMFLTVVKQLRPWSTFPAVTYTGSIDNIVFLDQDRAYAGENVSPKPIARIGGSALCALLPIGGSVSLNFYSNSYSYAGAMTHAWTFEGGSPSSSAVAGTSSSPITVSYSSTGEHLVSYTVTDANGSSTRYAKVYIIDRNKAYAFNPASDSSVQRDFEIASLSASIESGGWEMAGKLFKSANFIDGSQITLFTEQKWGGVSENIALGHVHQENILFTGWISASSVSRKSENDYIEFEAFGISGWLSQMHAWPSNFKHSGYGWKSIPNMTADLAVLNLLRYHSTVLNFCDFYPLGTNTPLLFVDCAEGDLLTQINNDIYSAMRVALFANRYSAIYARPNDQLFPIANRTDCDLYRSFDSDDWREELRLGSDLGTTVDSQVDFIGFYFIDSGDPQHLYALAPARELSTGQIEKVTGILVDDQDDNNIIAGLYLAWKNGEYQSVTLPSNGFIPLDLMPVSSIKITIDTTTTDRELNWTNKRFWITQISHNFGKSSPMTDVGLSAETDGPPGVTYYLPNNVPPQRNISGLGRRPRPARIPNPLVNKTKKTNAAIARYLYGIFVMDRTNGLYFTDELVYEYPRWQHRNKYASGVSAASVWGVMYYDRTRDFIVAEGDNQFYILRNPKSSTSLWERLPTRTTYPPHTGSGTVSSISLLRWFYAGNKIFWAGIFQLDSIDKPSIQTLDIGSASWNPPAYTITDSTINFTHGEVTLLPSSGSIYDMFSGVPSAFFFSTYNELWKSTNGGFNWSEFDLSSEADETEVDLGFIGNTDSIVIVSNQGSVSKLEFSGDDGVTFRTVSSNILFTHRVYTAVSNDRNKLLTIGVTPNFKHILGNSGNKLKLSHNYGETFSEPTSVSVLNNNFHGTYPGYPIYRPIDPDGVLWIAGIQGGTTFANGQIAVSDDTAVTWNSKNGNTRFTFLTDIIPLSQEMQVTTPEPSLGFWLIASDTKIGKSTNFHTVTSPTYTDVTGTVSGSVNDIDANPFSSAGAGAVTSTDVFTTGDL